jgi:hypothetical protein
MHTSLGVCAARSEEVIAAEETANNVVSHLQKAVIKDHRHIRRKSHRLGYYPKSLTCARVYARNYDLTDALLLRAVYGILY